MNFRHRWRWLVSLENYNEEWDGNYYKLKWVYLFIWVLVILIIHQIFWFYNQGRKIWLLIPRHSSHHISKFAIQLFIIKFVITMVTGEKLLRRLSKKLSSKKNRCLCVFGFVFCHILGTESSKSFQNTGEIR